MIYKKIFVGINEKVTEYYAYAILKSESFSQKGSPDDDLI